eukprot:TRINITY_DN5753_c0_g1_i2.p1 TRINITY_DN5753_c0_g1~~TRINITY_DN5753_c0_g1_i2.p1  ORF type:complete len:452 (+),score=53.70 TRINITY_DN5753_c0_g1_i2:101-1456(+)
MLQFYSNASGLVVTRPGRRWHSAFPHFGATPDGAVEAPDTREMRLVEVKCPLFASWLDYIPPDIMPQVQMQLEVFDCASCDVVVYFSTRQTIQIWRVFRSTTYWQWMEARLLVFWSCVQIDIPPDSIKYVYHEASDLARNHGWPSVCDPQSELPPRVPTTVVGTWKWDGTSPSAEHLTAPLASFGNVGDTVAVPLYSTGNTPDDWLADVWPTPPSPPTDQQMLTMNNESSTPPMAPGSEAPTSPNTRSTCIADTGVYDSAKDPAPDAAPPPVASTGGSGNDSQCNTPASVPTPPPTPKPAVPPATTVDFAPTLANTVRLAPPVTLPAVEAPAPPADLKITPTTPQAATPPSPPATPHKLHAPRVPQVTPDTAGPNKKRWQGGTTPPPPTPTRAAAATLAVRKPPAARTKAAAVTPSHGARKKLSDLCAGTGGVRRCGLSRRGVGKSLHPDK